MADAITPVWDESGKYLYFLASTDFGLNTGWLDMSSYDHPITRSLYLAVLSAGDASPLLPQSDEETAAKEEKKSEGPVTVTIDSEEINRIVAIDVPARNYTALAPAPEGFVFYMEAIPNQGTTLHKYDLKRKSEVFFPSINQAVVSKDRKSLLYQSNGTRGIVETSGAGKNPGTEP